MCPENTKKQKKIIGKIHYEKNITKHHFDRNETKNEINKLYE